MAPKHPTLFSRSFSIRTTRIALLLGLVAVAASILSSTSIASTISQRFFARAAAIVTGVQTAPARPSRTGLTTGGAGSPERAG